MCSIACLAPLKVGFVADLYPLSGLASGLTVTQNCLRLTTLLWFAHMANSTLPSLQVCHLPVYSQIAHGSSILAEHASNY